jgi:uncharacterized glyoxalase superfamily protein PhnB
MTVHVPKGFHTVTPRIVTADVPGLVTFVREVFGATGELRRGAPAEMKIGDSVVMISDTQARPSFPAFLYVYVADVEATYQRALKAGAVSLEDVHDTPYGDRRGMVQDPHGNVWQIATPLRVTTARKRRPVRRSTPRRGPRR